MNSPVWRRAATLRLDPPENVPMAGRKIGSFFSKQKIYVLYIYKLHIYIHIIHLFKWLFSPLSCEKGRVYTCLVRIQCRSLKIITV